jgi:hypothetical protein
MRETTKFVTNRSIHDSLLGVYLQRDRRALVFSVMQPPLSQHYGEAA